MERIATENLPFSKVDHVGVLVRDLDKAIEYYQGLGIGPFEPSGLTTFDRRVHGRPAEDIKNETRLARMGQLRLELVKPVSGESIQKKSLEEKGEGVHHLGFCVDNLDEEVAKLVAKGFKVIASAKFVGGGGSAFIDSDRVGGVFFELIQRPAP